MLPLCCCFSQRPWVIYASEGEITTENNEASLSSEREFLVMLSVRLSPQLMIKHHWQIEIHVKDIHIVVFNSELFQ